MSKKELSILESKFSFKITQKIGKGSFGTVYSAIDETDQSECAVKIIPKTQSGSNVIEGRLLQSLNHPHIVKFRRFEESRAHIVIVMDLMKGGTLDDLINTRTKSGQNLSEEESSLIMKSILSAVYYMHSQHVLHRDLKPANIMLMESDNLQKVQICDFGLGVSFSNEITFRSFLSSCGTVLFMSPEQLRKQPYSKPVDLWSCGIIMYMLLSMGEHPFAREKELQTRDNFVNHMSSSTLSIQQWPSCSGLAKDMVLKLTDLQPSNRYSAGKALCHPWITRRLSDEIPMSFEQNQQLFESTNTLQYAIKALIVLQLLKNKTPKYNIKRRTFQRNTSGLIASSQLSSDNSNALLLSPPSTSDSITSKDTNSSSLKISPQKYLFQARFHTIHDSVSSSRQHSEHQSPNIEQQPLTINKREFLIKKLNSCSSQTDRRKVKNKTLNNNNSSTNNSEWESKILQTNFASNNPLPSQSQNNQIQPFVQSTTVPFTFHSDAQKAQNDPLKNRISNINLQLDSIMTSRVLTPCKFLSNSRDAKIKKANSSDKLDRIGISSSINSSPIECCQQSNKRPIIHKKNCSLPFAQTTQTGVGDFADVLRRQNVKGKFDSPTKNGIRAVFDSPHNSNQIKNRNNSRQYDRILNVSGQAKIVLRKHSIYSPN